MPKTIKMVGRKRKRHIFEKLLAAAILAKGPIEHIKGV
jgi:hypothetical protein